jgi:hypothetical protein
VSRTVWPVAVVLAMLVSGCSVVPLPRAVAGRDQTVREQAWDLKDCQAEAGYRTGYSPGDSPLANVFQKVFFWGTAGAAIGGLIDGMPVAVTSTASEGLIAGAGAGGIAGTMLSWSGHTRFERAWTACMTARGYTVEAVSRAADGVLTPTHSR